MFGKFPESKNTLPHDYAGDFHQLVSHQLALDKPVPLMRHIETELAALVADKLIVLRFRTQMFGISVNVQAAMARGRPLDVAPDRVHITERGKLAFQHELLYPLAPDFVARLKKRAPDFNDRVYARCEDSAACLRHGLMRPCLAMLGLMFEEIVAQVYDDGNIQTKRNKSKAAAQFKTQLDEIIEQLEWQSA